MITMDGRIMGRFKFKLPEEWRDKMKVYMKIGKTLVGCLKTL